MKTPISTLRWMMDYDTTVGPVDLDHAVVRAALSPARMEMGLRDSLTARHAYFAKCGIGRTSCWVAVHANAKDLFEVRIMRIFNGTATELGAQHDVPVESLAFVTAGLWCDVCEQRGW